MIDVRTYGAVPDGTTDSAASINSAVAVGDIIIKNGEFLISESIKIPSNRTVYIKNARIKLADTAYDNIFSNSDFVNGNTNINIIGLGNAVLDGNSANNDDDYSTYGKGSSEFSYKYNLITWCGVDTFEIEGLTITDHSHWTITIQRCTNGSLHDIYLSHQFETVNQDGIDLVTGCNNITIYNIKGSVADDFFAINLLPFADFSVAIDGHIIGDCHDIECYNFDIYNAALGSMLAVVPYEGNKIYNINSHDHICRNAGTIMYTYVYGTTPDKTHCKDITIDAVTTITNMGRGVCSSIY